MITRSESRNYRASVRALTIAAPLLLALVAATSGRAEMQVAQPQAIALPDIPIMGVNGTASSTSKALPSQGRWLLIHVQPNCAPCDALLARIEADAPSVVPRLVIVVAKANAAELARVSSAFELLGAAAWYSDESGAMSASLQIQEAPVVLAMNDRSIQWTLAGVLSGSQRLRDVLTGWVSIPGN